MLNALFLFVVFDVVASKTFEKFFVMNFENKGYTQVSNNSKWKSIIEESFLLTNYYAITHPSQPNYIAEIAGDYFECVNDGACNMGYTSIVDLLENQGLTWKAYMENYKMQSDGSCYMSNSNPYCRQHNPFLSFTSITSTARCKNIVNEDVFQNDVISDTLPNYSFYSPNNNNNSHDQDLNFSGSYLIDWFQKWYYPYLTTTWKDTLFMAIWDEDAKEENNRVVAILRHPCISPGKTLDSSPRYTHYSMLRFVEDNFNLGTLGRNDKTATSFSEELICEEPRAKGKLVCPANITVEIESETDVPIVSFESPYYELLEEVTTTSEDIESLSATQDTDPLTEPTDASEIQIGGFSASAESSTNEASSPESQDSIQAAAAASSEDSTEGSSSEQSLAESQATSASESTETSSTPISSSQTSVQETVDTSIQSETTEAGITSQSQAEIENVATATTTEDQTTSSAEGSSISAKSTESEQTQESSAQAQIPGETGQNLDQETQLSSQSQSETTSQTSDAETSPISAKVEPTLISGLSSGSRYPMGTTFNTYQMLDDAGVACECSFSVTVTVRNVTSITTLDSQVHTEDESEATPMETTTTTTTTTTSTTTATTPTTSTGAQTQPEDYTKEIKVEYPVKTEEKLATASTTNTSKQNVYAALGVILPLLIITVVSLVGLWAYREKQREKSRLIENWNQETVSDPTTPLRTSSSQQYNYSQV